MDRNASRGLKARGAGFARVAFPIAVGLLSPLSAWTYPQSRFDNVTTEQEAQIGRIRSQEISQLKIVLGRRFSESRRPDILLRLAELYIEEYRFYFFKENQIHQKLHAEGVKPKHVDHERSRAVLKQATSACLAILKSKVPFAKMDQVYYFLGYNAEEMGSKKEAQRYFGEVVRRFPQSPYAPEAYRNLAEAAFEQKKYAQSLEYYEQAAKYTKVPSYPRTLYKLAWAYFKNRRKSDALEAMKQVISISGGNDKYVGLHDEALGDIVLFFSEAGRFREAREFFGAISGGPEIYVKALGKLVRLYEGRGDIALAVKVNDNLISEYGERRPELVLEALAKNVELYKNSGNTAGEEAALEKLVSFFAKNGADFAKSEDANATYLRTKNYLRARATDTHKDAQKKKDKRIYARAADLYGLYLRAFLASPDTDALKKELAEIRAYRSDALIAAGRSGEALDDLEKTMREGGDSKFRREAGATLLNQLIARLDASKPGQAGYGELEKRFLRVAEAFEDTFSGDPLVAELRYKKARLAAAQSGPDGLNRDARSALEELVEKNPDRAEASEAARDLVGDLLKRKKEDDAARLAQTFLANSKLIEAGRKSDLKGFLQSVIARQSFSNVQAIEKDSDFAKAAQEYERLAARAPDPEVAHKSLHNAAVNYEKADLIDDALRVHQALLSKFPGKTSSKDDMKRLASRQLWFSRFPAAAKIYSTLAGMPLYSTSERVSFGRTAFLLQWGSGDLASAYLTGAGLLQGACKASADERCGAVSLQIADVLIDAGRAQECASHLRGVLANPHARERHAEAAFKLASVYESMHETKKMTVYLEEAAGTVGRKKGHSGTERNFAARAAFRLVEPHFARFAAIRLELPEARLKQSTRAKLEALESLVSRYTAVVAYGDGEWGIAALERLYDAFSGFARELEQAPVPPGYEGPRLEAYKRGIAGVTAPMRARANEFLEQARRKGVELKITSTTYIALTQRLAKLSPREYPPAHYSMNQPGGQSRLRLLGTNPAGADRESWRKSLGLRLAQAPTSPDLWNEFGNLEAAAGHLKIARLMYEQAISLSARNVASLNNLAVILFLEQRPIEATDAFSRAADVAEFNRDVRLNLVRSLLGYHHFMQALEQLRPLVGRFPKDPEVLEAQAVALLGTAQQPRAAAIFSELDAEGSESFSLWYNWCVGSIVFGTAEQRSEALRVLRKRSDSLPALEKSQVELLSGLAGGK